MRLTLCKRSDNVLTQDFQKLYMYFFQFSIIIDNFYDHLNVCTIISLGFLLLIIQQEVTAATECWSTIDQHLLEERGDQKRRQALSQIAA